DVSAGTTFSNVSRGQLNSAAVSHTAGAIVTLIASGPDNSWWRLWKGNTSPALPLQAGDEFQVVRAIPAGSWVEGMQTVQIVNKTFTIAQVVVLGDDLYFKTTEAADDPALVTFGYTAALELLNPWYRSRDWKALIDGS